MGRAYTYIDQRILGCYTVSVSFLAVCQTTGEIMNQTNWLDVFNSTTTFAILTAIAIGVWFLVLKKDSKSKSSKR